MPKRLKAPSRCFKIDKRNTTIVLNDARAVIEQQLADPSKVRFVQKIRGAFDKTVGRPKFCKEGRKSTPLERTVCKIGAEVVKRLLGAIGFREDDSHTRSGKVLLASPVIGVGIGHLIREMKIAILIQVHEVSAWIVLPVRARKT